MAYEHKNNEGSLFKNKEKQKDTDPVYKGSGLLDGKECWLSIFLNTKKDGEKYLKLSVKWKDFAQREAGQQADMALTGARETQAKVYPADRITTGPQHLDDDIPF